MPVLSENGNLLTVTSLLAAAIMLSGIGQLMQFGGNLELVTNLGYPLYVLTILGIWKVLEPSLSSCQVYLDLKNGFTLVSSFNDGCGTIPCIC